MDSTVAKEVATEILPIIRVYKDGTVERLASSPMVPPSPEGDPQTGVLSKDISFSITPDSTLSARLYLPKLPDQQPHKLPILVYFHGGGFCIESAFSLFSHRYLNTLVSQAKVVAVSVEYRLAPEHLLPAAYDDCWDALNWVASHPAGDAADKEPWLLEYGDFERLFIGGDSSGGNIVHNVAMRGGVRILGAYLAQPFFWGSKPIGSEPKEGHEESLGSRIWKLVCPSGGLDDPMINPVGPGAPSLAGLGCSRMLVCVAEKDSRERGIGYVDAVRTSGWEGGVELFEAEGVGHAYHLFYPESDKAKELFQRLASFLNH